MRSSYVEFLAGIRAELLILLGVIPLGMIVSVLARSAGLSAGPTLAMSAMVFSGAAQLVAVQLMATGTPGAVIVLTTGVVNLRHLLYGASMAPHFRHLGLLRQGLLAYLLADEAYAVAISHYQHATSPSKHWYFLGAGLVLWTTWQVSTAMGSVFGALVPASWELDFTLALTLIAIVVPMLNDRAALTAALVAGGAAVLVADLPFRLGLMCAALTGILAGLCVERWGSHTVQPL